MLGEGVDAATLVAALGAGPHFSLIARPGLAATPH